MAKYYYLLSLLPFITVLTTLNLGSVSATTSTTLPPSNQDVDKLIEVLLEEGHFTINKYHLQPTFSVIFKISVLIYDFTCPDENHVILTIQKIFRSQIVGHKCLRNSNRPSATNMWSHIINVFLTNSLS